MSNNKKKLIIDRFEGEWAIVEYGRVTFDFPKAMLPKGSKEGDILEFHVSIQEEETERRKKNIESLAKQLFVEE